jgi:hypothetical protein
MTHSAQIQPWKLNSAVVDYMTKCAEAGVKVEPVKGRANFYLEGSMIFNGGQSAGDGGSEVIYDTEKDEKSGPSEGESSAETPK